MNDPLVQAMFNRSRHNNSSIFIMNQDYHELTKKTIRVNRNIYHIFTPNKFRDVQKLYQDKQVWICQLTNSNTELQSVGMKKSNPLRLI